MEHLMHFLNMNSGALTVVFSAVVMVSTVVYAILTWKLVSETQRMRKVQTDPQVEITLRCVEDAMNIQRLHVRNIGLGAARQISFQTEILSGDAGAKSLLDELTTTNFFNSGIAYLGPSEERFSGYTDMTSSYEAKIKSKFAFRIRYRDILGKCYGETIVIDMCEFKGDYRFGKSPTATIASSVEKIQKDLESIASRRNGIRANIFTRSDREAEQKAEQKSIREQIERSRQERGT